MPGAPLSIAMVTGDFDLSGIGTVTHVEGDRVYGFGHPMFSLGACEFPMMTGYIHTVYPRASVSMKMGSPLKVVGVLDTDVSTGVAGRIGPKPDMLPLSVRVKTGRYSEPHTYQVQIVREPNLLPTPGHGRPDQRHRHRGEPARGADRPDQGDRSSSRATTRSCFDDTLSGPRYTGPMGPAALFSPIASIVNILVRNPMAPVRIESIDCDVEISPGRTVAAIESVRLASDRLEPGQTLKAFVTLKPFKGERQTVELALPLPADFPEGPLRGDRLRRGQQPPPPVPQRARAARAARPRRASSRRSGSRPTPSGRRSTSTSPCPTAAWRSRARRCPNLPGSVRAVFASSRQSPEPAVRSDLIEVGRDALGRRGVADAQVHRGQGHGALVIVDRVTEADRRPATVRRACSPTRPRPRSTTRPTMTTARGMHARRSRPHRSSRPAALAGVGPRPSRPRPRRPRAKLETWRQERPRRFAKGHRERVVISDNGRVRLGQALGPLGTLDAARVWDLARTADGDALRRDRRRGQGLPPRGQGRRRLDRRLRRGRLPGPVAGRRCPTARSSSGPGRAGRSST